ncbi:cobyrinate a,c-diamide synthase [Aquisalimonas asiatica]|uniref:Cobyrinic acid a,c-diamide synthase n=1 Tax=Aquisalimonas asiatica TaxID=406100 RepID=A0A1H8UE86_9GAMM|nr:cobyrinate a,c-diamide synthase [Aquisalimonas asiatica]SEP01572.1 cobyrinic acid a,c-diamide synthase [Aquisalimonas asiatica]
MNETPVRGAAPAALISAPGSGSGKSMITAALARLHRNAGRDVRVFKYGPDYLDPMVLERASGNPVYQLHPWMTGMAECRWRLASAAAEADLVLVEGSMGLFDGDPCSADLAATAGLPVVPVIDASGMGQTFGAVALGLDLYRDDVCLSGVIANRTGSPGHGKMLADSLPERMPLLGAVQRNASLHVPDRHLGLVQAGEVADLDERLDAAAEVLREAGLDTLPATVELASEPLPAPPRLLEGLRIAVARDAAFAFIYRANLELLAAMGAEITEFSPLTDQTLPDCDALWLPGGYPELHARQLADNLPMLLAIRAHHAEGKPILAECGGLMACMDTLTDDDGNGHRMLGLLPGEAVMAGKLTGLGLQSLTLPSGELRGHTFHHSRLETTLEPAARTVRNRTGTAGEAVYRNGTLTASYYHAYFPSAPEAAAALFRGAALEDLDHA